MKQSAQPAAHAPPSATEPLQARMLNEFVYCPRLFYYELVEGLFLHSADTRSGKAAHARVDSGRGDLPDPEAPSGEDAPEVIHSRSVSLSSDRLGVTAKLDLVEVYPEADVQEDSPPETVEEMEAPAPAETDLFGEPIPHKGSSRTRAKALPATPDTPPAERPRRTPERAPLRVSPVEYKVGSPKDSDEGPRLWDADRMQLALQCLLLRDNGYHCEEGVLYYRGTRQRVVLKITPELEAWVEVQIAAARRCLAGPLPAPLVDSPKCPRCSLAPICLPDETRLLREAPTHPDDEQDEPTPQGLFPFDAEFAPERPPPAWSQAELGAGEILRPGRKLRRLIAPRADTKPLYVSSPGLNLGKRSELVVVKDKEGTVEEVRMVDLDHVAIFGTATLSTALVQALCEKDIPITYFSMGGWFYGLTRGHSLKNVFTRIEQFAAAGDPRSALTLAQKFVQGKIRNQRTLLMRNHLTPPADVLARLRSAMNAALESNDLGELLGIEGSAAAAYYSEFAGMIKVSDPGEEEFDAGTDRELFRFHFTHRNRRPPRDAVNALLSFAYSLLARDCTIAAQATGMDPYVGFYHQPRFGRPALALDLMEEFRPLVADSVVVTSINNRLLSPSDFVRAGASVNLSPNGRRRFLEAYERRMASTIVHPVFDYQVSYRRALELQARLLAKALTGDIRDYTPFTTR